MSSVHIQSAVSDSSLPRGGLVSKWRYLTRIVDVYVNRSRGPLSFWHEVPQLNEHAFDPGGTQYYMRFVGKAHYRGPFDRSGVPLLDYRGDIGPQYNPIAIAQYGLALYNLDSNVAVADRPGFVKAADWLVANLRPNRHGMRVWMHDFDWPYRERLVAPWYSGLAQGSGISLLMRAAEVSGQATYADAAREAFQALATSIEQGGTIYTDEEGNRWIEEYLVDPPSHILGGYIWALWGVYDYARWTNDPAAADLRDALVRTLLRNLHRYDTGFWSLYEIPKKTRRMLASPYYHALHIIEMRVMHRLTGNPTFAQTADRWTGYAAKPLGKARAIAEKAYFKLTHY